MLVDSILINKSSPFSIIEIMVINGQCTVIDASDFRNMEIKSHMYLVRYGKTSDADELSNMFEVCR